MKRKMEAEGECGSIEILAFFTHHLWALELFDLGSPHSMVSFLIAFLFHNPVKVKIAHLIYTN